MKKIISLGLLAVAGVTAISAGVAYSDTMDQAVAEPATMSPDAMHQDGSMNKVFSDGRLYVPDENYRVEWVQLGTFSVLADEPEDGAKEMHVVYAQREAIRAYLADGVFPDGTKIVKDVFETETEELTTGTASYAGTLAGRFVMVKDTDNLNAADSPLWGDGWGWAFYEGAETRQTVTMDYAVDCKSCHEPARETDFLYVQGYPLLSQ
jgi:Cytochrome P460